MRRIILPMLAMAIIVLFSFVSCSGDDENSTSTSTTDTVFTQKLTLTLNIPKKVGFTVDDNSPEFIWDGTTDKIFVLFQTTDGTKKATAEGKITVPANWQNGDSRAITIDVDKPKAFEMLQAYTVSGAIGVKSIDKNGNCTIEPPTAITGDYNIPMYFVKTAVTDDQASLSIKRYGALLNIHPKTSTSANLTKIAVATGGVFSTRGTFNVNTDSYPTYKAADSYKVADSYQLKKQLTQYYVWVKSNDNLNLSDNTKNTVKIQINGKQNGSAVYWVKNRTRTALLTDEMSYEVEAEKVTNAIPIISQVLYVNVGQSGYVEIYNPSDVAISLEGYSISDVSGNSFSLTSINSFLCMENGQTTSAIKLPTEIAPKELIVYAGSKTSTINRTQEAKYFSSSSSYTYYKNISAPTFMPHGASLKINLQYNGKTVDQAQTGLNAEFNMIRRPTNNTPQTTFVWEGYWYRGIDGRESVSGLPYTDIYNGHLGRR